MNEEQSHTDLIWQYEAFAMHCAHQQRRQAPAWKWPEIRQAAMVGLTDAAGRYDPGKGFSFTTYAKYRIRGAIIDQLRDSMHFGRSTKQHGIQVINAGGGECIFDGGYYEDYDEQILIEEVLDVIGTLPERNRDALAAHISGEPYSELTKKYNVCEVRISQFKNEAIQMVREKLGVTVDE